MNKPAKIRATGKLKTDDSLELQLFLGHRLPRAPAGDAERVRGSEPLEPRNAGVQARLGPDVIEL